MIFKQPVHMYKGRWTRRLVIILSFPQECVRAIYHVTQQAILCWRTLT